MNISQVILFFFCIFREVFFAVQLGREREGEGEGEGGRGREREGEIERASR